MEASTEQQTTDIEQPATEAIAPGEPRPDDPAGQVERSPAETRDSSRLFEYSRYLHVGPGAEECENGENGKCDEPMHFHAWLRLPNQFQHSSIREKALAAKARRLRVLRDPESDSRTILDGEIEEMLYHDDRESLIEQVVNADFLKDHLTAMRTVQDDEEFAHIEEDRERFNALAEKSEQERPAEEFEELKKHVDSYVERVNEERVKIQSPLRESLNQKQTDELVVMVREQRMQVMAQEEFDSKYSLWEQFVGTLQPTSSDTPGPPLPNERVFGSVEHLQAAAPEVVDALAVAYRQIEAAAGRSLQAPPDG